MATLVAGLALAGPAVADHAPQKLLQEYPLDPTSTLNGPPDALQAPPAGTTVTGTTTPSSSSSSPSVKQGGGGVSSELVIGLLTGLVIALIGTALLVARYRPELPRHVRAQLRWARRRVSRAVGRACLPLLDVAAAVGSAVARAGRGVARVVRRVLPRARVQLRRIHVPRVHLPSVRLPRIHMPRVRVPRVHLPPVHLPSVHLPRIRVPRVHMPRVHFPRLHLPRVSVPSVPRRLSFAQAAAVPLPEPERPQPKPEWVPPKPAVAPRPAAEPAAPPKPAAEPAAPTEPAPQALPKDDVREILPPVPESPKDPSPSASVQPLRSETPAVNRAERRRGGRSQRRQPRDTVRIDVWSGYVSGEFYAVTTSPQGDREIVASSPVFRWLRKREGTPPEKGKPLESFRALVAKLEKDGWQRVGEDDERWFEQRFSRPAA
ncbi:MAG TPA: hypothetical protein VH306_02180 [Gaiellaceae bacterium]